MKTLLLLTCAASLGAQTLPLDPANWSLSGIQKPPKLQAINGALAFDFGTRNQNSANYLYTFASLPTGASQITVIVSILTTGAPLWRCPTEPNDICESVAHFRLYFEADSSIWTNSAGDTFRWWSNPQGITLANGIATITVPLTGDQWSTVYGRAGTSDAEAVAGFQSTLQNTALLGGTFGSDFFGHGVYIQMKTGTAQFQLLSYSVF